MSEHFGQDIAVSIGESGRDSIEYAGKLFEEGRLKEARSVLYTLDRTGQLSDDGYIMLAYIEFWDGKPGRAKNLLNRIDAGYHEMAGVQYLRNEIENQQTGQIQVAYNNKRDNQPLSSNQIRIVSSAYRNKYIHPEIDAMFYSFDTESGTINSLDLKVNNTFRTGLTGHSLAVAMGIYSDSAFDFTEIIGGIKYTHRFTGRFYSDVEFTKEPYLYHYRNLTTPFYTYQFIGGLRYFINNRFYSEFKLQRWIFEDENHQDILSFYYVQNILNSTRSNLYIGYAFSYSTAQQSRFIPEQPEVNTSNTLLISGIYFPYYTPNQDRTHSIILSTESDLTKRVSANLSLKYGIYATARQPFYYIGQSTPSTIEFDTYNFQHHPFELSGGATFSINRSLSIYGKYEYKQLKYYTTNDFVMTLRILI